MTGPTFDNEKLITLVEEKPVLWNKNYEKYRNREDTRKAWGYILKELIPNYETLDDKTQQSYARLIHIRWNNIRDNYSRYVKKTHLMRKINEGGNIAGKPYVYSKKLTFLNSVLQHKDTERHSNDEFMEVMNNEEYNHEDSEKSFIECYDSVIMNPSSETIETPIETERNPLETKLTQFMELITTQRTTDRHLSFFKGIKPTLDSFNDEEVVEFQFGVMQLLRNIMSSRRLNEPVTNDITAASSKRRRRTEIAEDNIDCSANISIKIKSPPPSSESDSS